MARCEYVSPNVTIARVQRRGVHVRPPHATAASSTPDDYRVARRGRQRAAPRAASTLDARVPPRRQRRRGALDPRLHARRARRRGRRGLLRGLHHRHHAGRRRPRRRCAGARSSCACSRSPTTSRGCTTAAACFALGEHMMRAARRHKTGLGVLFLDLDGLKDDQRPLRPPARRRGAARDRRPAAEARIRESDVAGARRRRRVRRGRRGRGRDGGRPGRSACTGGWRPPTPAASGRSSSQASTGIVALAAHREGHAARAHRARRRAHVRGQARAQARLTRAEEGRWRRP